MTRPLCKYVLFFPHIFGYLRIKILVKSSKMKEIKQTQPIGRNLRETETIQEAEEILKQVK